ncbi:ABC transporter permease subunit [Nocardioides maradonensis]
MVRFLIRRVALMVVALWGLATLVFVMTKAIPGDEAAVAAGPTATADQVAQMRHALGLDTSVFHQYASYLWRLSHGDLGTSLATYRPIRTDLLAVIPSTVELVAVAMAINVLIGVPMGVVAASYRGRWPDVCCRVVSVVLGGFPVFWLGYMLQFLFGAQWHLLPAVGQIDLSYDVPKRTGFLTIDSLLSGNLPAFGSTLTHLVLPAAALAAPFCAVLFRMTRASLLTQLNEDYVLLSRAKGASQRRIMVREVLRNGSLPIITLSGVQLGWMLGSAVLVESIFNRPGVGSYLTTAVLRKDTFAVLGSVVFIGVVIVILNFIIDCLPLALDPRIRSAQAVAA